MNRDGTAKIILSSVVITGNNTPLLTNQEAWKRHTAKFASIIRDNKEIVFVLPGFPAKSPNRQKTFGSLPDVAELVALGRLDEMCERISDYYRPGARAVICSDGSVFGDLVMVSDVDVAAYSIGLRKIIDDNRYQRLQIFNMSSVFGELESDAMRLKLVSEYGESLEEVRNKIISCPEAKNKFNGIHRFVLEDRLVLEPEKTKSKIRTESKAVAYQVVQRSDSWGNLVKKFFPNAIRLSIHPQPITSERIFFQLANCANTWCTPWHSTAMMTHRGFCLIRRDEAEKRGAELDHTSHGLPFFSLY